MEKCTYMMMVVPREVPIIEHTYFISLTLQAFSAKFILGIYQTIFCHYTPNVTLSLRCRN